MFVLILTCLCILVVSLDIVHIVRMLTVIVFARRSIRSILDVVVHSKMCIPLDLDICLHMNNANYLKHCDIARLHLWLENGVWQTMEKHGGSMVIGGSCNRYRKAITLFTKYKLKTKVIYWDDTAFYVEQTFVRDSDGFICFISIIKQTIIRVKPDQILEALGYDFEKPEILPELQLWIESTSSSSERLRKKS